MPFLLQKSASDVTNLVAQRQPARGCNMVFQPAPNSRATTTLPCAKAPSQHLQLQLAAYIAYASCGTGGARQWLRVQL